METIIMAIFASPLETVIGCSAILGIVFHQIIRHFEPDSRGWEMILVGVFVNTLLFAARMKLPDGNVWTTALHTSAVNFGFLTGLYGSMLGYRAFFHKLRLFPGPFAARLSKFYHTIVMTRKDLRYHRHIQKLHERYGDFVRTGPRELSITRISAINLIYGPNSVCTKGTWYDQNSSNPNKVGIENIRSEKLHRLRRKAWEMGLGFRALSTYENRIKTKVDALMDLFGSGKPLNVTQTTMFYSFDVMADIAFSSEEFNMLHTLTEHPAVAGLHEAMSFAGLVTTVPWLMNMLRVIPGATGKFEQFAGWCYSMMRQKRKSVVLHMSKDSNWEPQDAMSWIIKAQIDGDRSASPTEASIQEDARTLISAGSDTVAITFTNVLYFLATCPRAYQKLQKLTDATFPDGYSSWTYDKAKSIKYIDHIIHESLRLRPAVPIGFLRQTPAEGLQIDEIFVPGDTIVNVPIWTIHRDGRYFEDPEKFVPERWDKLSPDTAAFLPFQRGPFNCVGKQVGLQQLRMLISCVALRFDVAFAPGEDGVDFVTKEKETLVLWNPPLKMVFSPR